MLSSISAALTNISALTSWARRAAPLQLLLLSFLQYSDKKGNIYNILWVLVFGFATLNILGLVARRFEPERARLSMTPSGGERFEKHHLTGLGAGMKCRSCPIRARRPPSTPPRSRNLPPWPPIGGARTGPLPHCTG